MQPDKETRAFNKKAEKHAKDTVNWITIMSHKFTTILGAVALGGAVDMMEDELRLYYKLMLYEKELREAIE